MKEVIIVTERALSELEQIKYERNRYKVFNIFAHVPNIFKEQHRVAVLLEQLYAPTIRYIEKLLYFNHKVTIKYKDKTFVYSDLDMWKESVPYLDYLDKNIRYKEKQNIKKLKEHLEPLLPIKELMNQEVDIENFLHTFTRLYEIPFPNTEREKLLAYQQIKFYIENNLEYFSSPQNIEPEDEAMFSAQDWNGIQVITIGDELLLEDYIYKRR